MHYLLFSLSSLLRQRYGKAYFCCPFLSTVTPPPPHSMSYFNRPDRRDLIPPPSPLYMNVCHWPWGLEISPRCCVLLLGKMVVSADTIRTAVGIMGRLGSCFQIRAIVFFLKNYCFECCRERHRSGALLLASVSTSTSTPRCSS